MGQYHIPVNLTKREFLDPHGLGDGLKLREQIDGPLGGIPAALVVLLAASNGRGGGDLPGDPIVGRWAGDQIAIVGDYAEDTDLPDVFQASTIYAACMDGRYRDITPEMRRYFAQMGITYEGEGWLVRRVPDDGR